MVNTDSLKILFIHDYPPTEGGGVEVNVFKSAKELVKRGHEVVIGTSRFSSETYKSTPEFKQLEGVRIELLDSMEKLKGLIDWADIAHIYFTFSCRPASMEALRYCVENDTKCIFSIRTSYRHIPFSSLGSMTALEKESKINFLKEYLVSDDVYISAPSNCIKESIEWLRINKVSYPIHNGTDFSSKSKDASSDVTISPVDITYLGEISFLKGINYLIDAIRNLHKDIPDLKVRLIGGGSDIKEMKQLVEYFDLENVVSFVGYISNANVASYLKASKVYVQPSLTETWSNSVLEALSFGVPVICSRIEGLVELTSNGEFAELVTLGNSQELENIFRSALTDKKYMKALQKKARVAQEYTTSRYTLNRQVSDMEDLYKKVLSS